MEQLAGEERLSKVLLHQEQQLSISANGLPTPGKLGDKDDNVGREDTGLAVEVAGGAAAELAVEFVELDMADAAVEGAGTAGVGCSAVPDDASGVTAQLDTAVEAAVLRADPKAGDLEAAVIAASEAAVPAAFFSLN